jgi:hypothetical protein
MYHTVYLLGWYKYVEEKSTFKREHEHLQNF